MNTVIVHDLKSYKLAKAYVRDLDLLISQTEKAISFYTQFNKYKPVKRLLETLLSEYDTLKGHRNKCSKIIETRGLVLR